MWAQPKPCLVDITTAATAPSEREKASDTAPVSERKRAEAADSVEVQGQYPLVNKHSYGKWPFIVDFPIENGVFL